MNAQSIPPGIPKTGHVPRTNPSASLAQAPINNSLPPIRSAPKIDEGQPWSIGITPLSGETPEECENRLEDLLKTFNTKLKEKGVSRFMPEWLTPNLLYRINYGPLKEREFADVAFFIRQQHHDFEAYYRLPTIRSAYHRSWRSYLPWHRPQIKNRIESLSSIENSLLQCTYPNHVQNVELSIFGFLDPKLGEEILKLLYGQSSIERRQTLHYTPQSFPSERVLMLFELAFAAFMKDAGKEFCLLPFGALCADALKLIDIIKDLVYAGGETDISKLVKGCLDQASSSTLFYTSLRQSKAPSLGRTQGQPQFSIHGVEKMELLHPVLWPSLDPGVWGYDLRSLNLGYINDWTEKVLGLNEWGKAPPVQNLESGPVDLGNLDASYICSGPYGLMLTTRPERHLYIDSDGFVHIFWDFREVVGESLDVYKGHFLWDPNWDGPSETISDFQKELHLTHRLLFCRNDASLRLGEHLYGVPINGKGTFSVRLTGDFDGRLPNISEFRLLGPRIKYLLRAMEMWRPRRFREVFIPAYSGRMDWWVAMFAIFFGVISILSLGFTVYQSVLSQKQLKAALDALNTGTLSQ